MAASLRLARQRPAVFAALASGGVGGAFLLTRFRHVFSSAAQPTAQSGRSLLGYHAIVVGGTSGIGHGIALGLAKAGCSVTVVGRSESRGKAVVGELAAIAAVNAAPAQQPSFVFEALDCFSLPACNVFASRCASAGRPLDYLVLTQGMASMQGFTPTPATSGGLDEKMTLHYWSRALLAKRLAPLLEKSGDGRVLSVLSAGVHGPYPFYVDDPELSRGSYSLKAAADAAGFYNDIAAEQLSLEHPNVSFLHVAPGFVATSWGTEMPTYVRLLVRVFQVFGRSKEQCGSYMLKGLHSEQYKGGGWYLLDQYGEPTPKQTILHDVAKAQVWAHTKAVIERLHNVT